jgi:hypothetical protein
MASHPIDELTSSPYWPTFIANVEQQRAAKDDVFEKAISSEKLVELAELLATGNIKAVAWEPSLSVVTMMLAKDGFIAMIERIRTKRILSADADANPEE